MELDFNNPQICVFLGKPKQGKSYALRHILLKNTIDKKLFKYGLVFTKTKFNGGYDYLPDEYVYEDYNPEILQQYLDGLKELDEKNLQPSFIVFDDIQGVLSNADPTGPPRISDGDTYPITCLKAATLERCDTKLKTTVNRSFSCNCLPYI